MSNPKNAGRKSKYDACVKPYLADINKKVRQGVTEAEIAKALGISIATLNNYKSKYHELAEALSKDKGADVLQRLINAGIESACGYYKENETTTVIIDELGNPSKRQKTVTKVWYAPNPALNKFYTMIYGKDEGFTNDPLDYELKKARQETDEALLKAKNWDIDF